MYSYMLVDDDKLVRERIRSLIPEEELELELSCQAEDGVTALELFELRHPQIVILDINIPIINGIDVARHIISETPDTKIIMITGFGTTENARDALRSGVVDYLLKPVNPQELLEVLKKSIRMISDETTEALERQRIERLLEQGMPLIRSRYFFSLLDTDPDKFDDELFLQNLKDFGITEIPSKVCVAIIIPDYQEMNTSKIISMQSVLESELTQNLENKGIRQLSLYDSMQRMIVITYGETDKLEFLLEQTISTVHDKLRYLYSFDFKASIGSTADGFRSIKSSYQDAIYALGYLQILGNNNIVNSNNIMYIDQPVVDSVSTPHYSEIQELLVSENNEGISLLFENYINRLAYASHHSIGFMQRKTIELVALLLTCAEEIGVDTAEFYDSKTSVYEQIIASVNVFDILDTVKSTYEKLICCIHDKRNDSKNRALRSAMQYISHNYQDASLDLITVSEHVKLSPGYLAQLFRKYENCSFTDYLNKTRIEHAQKLLLTTHLRVYEVSEAVGFQNSKYFFQVFKQLTGMRPREYYENSIAKTE